ncbi:MAG: hypothetical protein AB7F86_08890 [Bdellovibrionales bacterium]
MKKYRPRTLSRTARTELAKLMIRVGAPQKALSILYGVVRSANPHVKPEPTESAVYAHALLKIGSFAEAEKILLVLPESLPDVHLFQGSAKQMQWDYRGSIDHLLNYVQHTALSDPYARAVAMVNLAAAYVGCGEFDLARATLSELEPQIAKNGWSLLNKNCQELSAQIAFHQKDWQRAEHLLNRAGREGDAGLSDLMIQKWSLFCRAVKAPSEEAIAEIVNFRDKAAQIRHSETVRECDRMIGQLKRDPNLMNKVYFGTPHESYRKMLLQNNPWFDPPPSYLHGDPGGVCVDLLTAVCAERSEVSLQPGKMIHRALCSLFNDFYRPQSMGSLFASFFPDEFFNPLSGPGRISTVIHRVRTWAVDHRLPLEINKSGGIYQIDLRPGLAFRIHAERAPTDMYVLGYLHQLRPHLGENGSFQRKEMADLLGISKAKANMILKRALESGLITRRGLSRFVRYELCG